MSHTARIPLYTLAPANLKAMIALSVSVKDSSLGERLRNQIPEVPAPGF
jgi:hypothetical protein